MALIQCKDCKAQISNSAKACPACGAPPPKKTSLLVKLILGIFVIGVLKSAFTENPPPTAAAAPIENPAEIAAKKAENAVFRTVLLGAQKIKASTKNPDSFTLTKAFQLENGTLCYEYRGTNSFNATVPGFYTITPNTDGGTTALYNKFCAGQTGRDYTYIKSAL